MKTPSKFSHSQLTDVLEVSGARLRPPVNLEAPLPEQGVVLRGQFHVGAFLGSGGMGLVFRGKDLETGASIVIKTLRAGATHQELQRFVKEAALELPTNPHIVRSIAHFVCGQRPYYVQEYIEGHSLADILHARQEGRNAHNHHERSWFDASLAIPRAVEAVAQIADALQELHDRGIVHRDVKPANLVWSDNERPVLIDFGLALNHEDQSQSKVGNVVGTGAYLAPELAAGGAADGRSDIYSLAVTLWQLLTGVLPMGLPQRGSYLGSNLPIDTNLLGILQTALEPNRKFRFARASSFAEALRGWLHGEKGHSSQKSSVSIRRWIYFRRFEFALGTSIVAVAASIMLALYVFNYRVESEAERRTNLVSDTRIALGKQNDFLGGKDIDDQEFIRSLFAQYKAMLVDKDGFSEKILREARTAAIELGIRTGAFVEIEPFLSSHLELEWTDFNDAHLDASIYSGLGQFENAIQVLRKAESRWPTNKEVISSAIEILGYFSSAKTVELGPGGMYARSGLPKMPIVMSEGTVQVAQLSETGALVFEPVSTPNAFPFGQVMSACLVQGPQGEMGRMFYHDPREGPVDATQLLSGVYWQPSGSLDPPILLYSSNPQIGLSQGLGLLPIDIDGDGQDEVFAPFSNSAAQSFLLNLEGDQWIVRGLPGKGGDVHGLYFLQAGGQRQLAIATSQWNEQHQGMRIRTFDFSANTLSFAPGMNAPLGAIQSWERLRGWPEHSVASFEWVDDAQFFGGKYRNARAGEIWTLSADPRKGIFAKRRLGGGIRPKRLGDTTSVVIPMDLDNDGRDEIYWSMFWGEKALLTVLLIDNEGDVLSFPLGIMYRNCPRSIEVAAGIPGILFPDEKGIGSTSLLVQGALGDRTEHLASPIGYGARRVFTVRGEGPVLEGEFEIPSDWKPGDDALWFEADLRLVHPDFDSFGFFAMETEGKDGVSRNVNASLAMRVVGGGDVYEHRLGLMNHTGFEPDRQGGNSHIQLIPGGWVHITIGPAGDGTALECRLVQEEGTPGNPQSCKFSIALQPVAGAAVRWDWRSSPPGNVAEARDETAVLAWDWLGPGHVPEVSFALSDEIGKSVELGEAMIQALEDENEEAFDRAKAGLEEIMGGPRVAIPSERRQNSLARYFLEEYGGLFLKVENQSQ